MQSIPYWRTPAYRSAVAHPYHVHLHSDWFTHTVSVGFQTEEEARAFAASRPEPIIDMVKRDCGVVAVRRTLMHPDNDNYPSTLDDFPQS